MKTRIIALGLVCLVATGVALAHGNDGPVAEGAAPATAATPATPAKPAPATAQEEPGTVSRIYNFKVKNGMEQQFEEAIKAHIAFLQENNASWPWTGFTVETGPNSGWYGFVSGGHTWADFDHYDATIREAAMGHFQSTVSQYVETFNSVITMGMPHMSNPAPDTMVPGFAQVIHYHVKFDMAEDFAHVATKIHKGLKAEGWSENYLWSTAASGGEGPMFTLVLLYESWADMAEPEETFEQVLQEHYGATEFQNLMETVADCAWKVESWTARIRTDLSYIPGGGY